MSLKRRNIESQATSTSAMNDVHHTAKEQSDATNPRSHPIPSRGRPPKRSLNESASVGSNVISVPHGDKTFIMKLFDRSLDLSNYGCHSVLYPICRAWMVNQPRSRHLINFKHRVLPPPEKRTPNTTLDDLQSGLAVDVYAMPPIKKVDVRPLERPEPSGDRVADLNLNYDMNAPPCDRATLLADLQQRCVAEQKRLKKHTAEKRSQAYGESFRVLSSIFKQ